MGMAETPGEASQVQNQLESLESVSHTIAKLVEELETRLTRVLLPVEPVDKSNEPGQQLVPLAENISTRVRFLSSQADKLRDILARIEL